MEIRFHPITGEPILFAPERASRPRAFGGESADRCPFCPGHEGDTPAEVLRVGDPWRVRVFPNKYPPVAGAEVIVESPAHGDAFDSIADPEEAVRVYADRYRAHSAAAYVSLFKNEGPAAGSSIPHLHSQLLPLGFIPPRQLREAAAFAGAAACPLCPTAGETIAETASLLWLAPRASTMAYQQWIVPKRHVADFGALTANELRDLAELLRTASAAMRSIRPAYNWTFMSFPHESRAHFYVELYPRVSALAGLELGGGTFVQIVDPLDAARLLADATTRGFTTEAQRHRGHREKQ